MATNQAGSLTNTATATCGTLSASDTATVTVVSTGDLTVTKAFDYDGATPAADDVTTINSVTTPKDFAATLTLKQDDTVVKTASYVNGVFSFTDVPYGEYTVVETITAGNTIGGTKNNQTGTLTYHSNTLATVTIDGAEETATITNNYTFAASDEVKVYYEWGTAGSTTYKDVADTITLPADATLTFDSAEHKNYTLQTFSANNLPDGYEVDTTYWYKDEACTVVASDADVRSLLGGQTITLYAKLTYGNPNYQLRYHLFYGENGEEPLTPTSMRRVLCPK